MADRTHRIEVQIRIPVHVRLDVTWDEENEQAVVHRGEIAPFQQAITESTLFENLSDEEREYLDEEARKACLGKPESD